MLRKLLSYLVPLTLVGCGSPDRIDEPTPGNVWELRRPGNLTCQVLTSIDGVERSNGTIVPYPNSKKVTQHYFDHDRGRRYDAANDTSPPRGTYIGHLSGNCTYRAPYGEYNEILRHFEDAPFGGHVEVGKDETFEWPQLDWIGEETVSDISAGWVLALRKSQNVTGAEALNGSAKLAWPVVSTRYGVTVSRCFDGDYPPQVENTDEDNNVVCITIEDGGVRQLHDWVAEHLQTPFPEDDPRSEFADYRLTIRCSRPC